MRHASLLRGLQVAFAICWTAVFGLVSHAQTFTNVSSRLSDQDEANHGAWGASFVDIDGNGLPDVYEPGILFLQQHDGVFLSSLASLGIPLTKSAVFGSVFADVDDDGFPEMFTIDLSTANSVFYKNHKGFILADSTQAFGFTNLKQGQGTNFGDYNQDGFIDLFMGEETGKNQLFFGDGTGHFTETTHLAGIETDVRSYGVASVDFDNDGDLDVFIAACAPLSRELSINKFFQNNGDGTFTEIGEAAGVNDDLSSWGITWLDYDRDGDMDTYIVNMAEADGQSGHNVLYRNNGNGTFSNMALEAGVRGEQISFSYGTSSADFNNDGWVDLFVSNRAAPPYLFINNGDGTFTNRYTSSGTPLVTNNTSVAVADFNQDGWIDFFSGGDFGPQGGNITNQYSILMMNDGGTNGFLTVSLIQPAPNKRGIGSRLEVWKDGTIQLRDITAGDGFTSQNMDFTAHFGLGTATSVDSLVVKWPDGTRDRLENVNANQHLYIEKGGLINKPPSHFKAYQTLSQAHAGKAEADFNWETSIDPEGEPILYVVTVKTTEGKIVYESAPVETPYLRAEFEIDRSSFEYRWVVTATDGLHVRRSLNEENTLLVVGDAIEESVQPSSLALNAVYPNPFSNVLSLEILVSRPEDGIIELVDLLGRVVSSEKISMKTVGTQQLEVDTTKIPAGAYLVRLVSKTQSVQQVVLKL